MEMAVRILSSPLARPETRSPLTESRIAFVIASPGTSSIRTEMDTVLLDTGNDEEAVNDNALSSAPPMILRKMEEM